MTEDELKTKTPAFRAGYSDGYRNIAVQPIPTGARENIADYWWGYHKGKGAKQAENRQQRLIP